MKPRKSRTISQAAQPAQLGRIITTGTSGRRVETPSAETWITKDHAAKLLAIGKRQIETLIKREGWKTKKEKLDGRRQASTLINVEDVRAYHTRKSTQTIDHETGQQVAKRADPARQRTTPAGDTELSMIAAIVGQCARVAESIVKTCSPPPASTPPYRWLTLRQAAEHIGLPPAYLRQACVDGRLPSITVGSGKNAQRMVRAGDAEQLGARQAGGRNDEHRNL